MERANVDPAELQLVDGAAAGDREARRALFERYREIAYRVAVRITRRDEDALDVVQDSFIRAFERLSEFQREAGFRTWLLRIVSNRALDLLRSRRVRLAVRLDGEDDERGPELPSEDPADQPMHGLERLELAQRLRRAIDRLPMDQRAAFALYATGEMTYGQIAEALGIPIGTVMSRLFHARRRLHEMLPDLAPRETKEVAPDAKSL
jgi:RNA polymerase sigma-70 factor (ECF subfamily)